MIKLDSPRKRTDGQTDGRTNGFLFSISVRKSSQFSKNYPTRTVKPHLVNFQKFEVPNKGLLVRTDKLKQ